jgi:RHS repeat-associated protein
MQPNIIQPVYNEANLLEKLDVWVRYEAAVGGLLDPTSPHLEAVTNFDYNARGQRTLLAMGNGTVSTFDYDSLSFRLVRLTTTRLASFDPAQRVVQDLEYTYDPAGNITRIYDSADIQNVVFFRNQRIDPSSSYVYDAVYRLKSATGREHLGQNGGVLNAPQQVANDDSSRILSDSPTDGNAMGRYTETYTYDAVGNILAMAHQVGPASWTRRYTYAEPSQVDATQTNNRLTATSMPGDPQGGPYSATYDHDAHGNIVRMPHLPAITWDTHDRIGSTTRQVVNAGVPETTYYSYDSGWERQRKVTCSQAHAVVDARRQHVRLYLGALEIYREFDVVGSTVTLERETLHVQAGQDRIAVVETRTAGSDPGAAQLVRYQHTNLLGSAVLELDDQAQVISYEDYLPYGSTAYQGVRSSLETPKRYRYTGKQRDEESDLYYHGARYSAPWLGRWLSCDPAGVLDAMNLYLYVGADPVGFHDSTGKKRDDPPGAKVQEPNRESAGHKAPSTTTPPKKPSATRAPKVDRPSLAEEHQLIRQKVIAAGNPEVNALLRTDDLKGPHKVEDLELRGNKVRVETAVQFEAPGTMATSQVVDAGKGVLRIQINIPSHESGDLLTPAKQLFHEELHAVARLETLHQATTPNTQTAADVKAFLTASKASAMGALSEVVPANLRQGVIEEYVHQKIGAKAFGEGQLDIGRLANRQVRQWFPNQSASVYGMLTNQLSNFYRKLEEVQTSIRRDPVPANPPWAR